MQPDLSFFMEVKDVAEDGTFTGIASVYDMEDLGGDVIEKGAFKKTISENPVVPILWQHDSYEVIGSGEVKESGNKILLSGKLDMEDPMAQKAHRKMKGKLVKGLSIGFQTIKSTFQDIEQNGANKFIRRIQELKLWEVSVVTFPMLPAAQVMRVKSAEDWESRFRSLEAKFEALQAKKSTPQEPLKAEEPQEEKSTEPEVDHSLLESTIQLLRDGNGN